MISIKLQCYSYADAIKLRQALLDHTVTALECDIQQINDTSGNAKYHDYIQISLGNKHEYTEEKK
jgi:hypothetical protein